jgi:serralysin
MCALCGNPTLVHDGSAVLPSTGGDQPAGRYAQPAPDITEGSDAANGTGTTYNPAVNQVVQGQIGSTGDHDWYRVNLTAGQTYTFALVGTGINDVRDPELFLRNSAGGLIISDDDSGPESSSAITYTATASGTYYLDAGAFNNGGTGQYGLSITQGTRAHYDIKMGAGAVDADTSWSGTPGTGATVTYGFRMSAPGYAVAGSATQATFSQLTAQEIAAVDSIMQLWSDASGITFTLVNPGGYTDNATILFSNYYDQNDGAGAFAFYPGSTAAGSAAGDVYLNTSSVSTTSLPMGSYSFFAIMHEVGHAIGLSHPGDYNAAPGTSITYANNAQFIEDSHQYSVMSYFDEANTGGSVGGYPDTPMLFDIYASQQVYGADMTTRTGNTIYGFGSNAGAAYNFSANSAPGLCIWDAGGTDTLDCSGFSQNQLITLTAGLFSNIGSLTGNVSIALGAVIENAVGGSGNDTINGNSADNTLNGGNGNDTMSGFAGNDLYYLNSVSDIVIENPGEGVWDQIFTTVNYTMSANVESMVLQGSATNGTGSSGFNAIYGNSLDNLLDGAGGGDALFGFAGNDLYYVDSINDTVTENLGEGAWDQIISSVNYTMSANVESMVLQGSATNGIGSSGFNAIYGNNLDNVLDGAGGGDALFGFAGNDLYYVDSAGDTVSENPGEGVWDQIITTVNYTMSANIESMVLQGSATNGTGNSSGNAIYGNGLNNVLDGAGGNDALFGFGGNDLFMFSSSSFGRDTVADFQAGAGEIIEFHNTFQNFSQVQASAQQAGNDTVITWDANNTVTLQNVLLSNLHASDFHFF